MSNVYMYVVDRDFGFAPNPFHGYCTLATCMARLRARAQIGDWVIGMGGSRLKATGRCIYAMKVTNAVTFDRYWSDPTYRDKKPVRNGSRKMMVGDNIYHRDSQSGMWHQADSHHSNPDGTANLHNIANDTKADRVLISAEFFYFGLNAVLVPPNVLGAVLGYKNGRNYRVYDALLATALLNWLATSFRCHMNLVGGDPFDFHRSDKRYSVRDNKIK